MAKQFQDCKKEVTAAIKSVSVDNFVQRDNYVQVDIFVIQDISVQRVKDVPQQQTDRANSIVKRAGAKAGSCIILMILSPRKGEILNKGRSHCIAFQITRDRPILCSNIGTLLEILLIDLTNSEQKYRVE